MDGAYKGKYTDPGGFVQTKQTFTYIWEATPGTEGAWLYHDHGPMDPVPVYKGLFGPLLIRDRRTTPADREFFVGFHTFPPVGDRAQHRILLHQRPRLRGQHADAARRRSASASRSTSTASTTTSTPSTSTGTAGPTRTGPWSTTKTLGPGDSFTPRVHRGQPGPMVLPLPRVQPPPHGDERVVHRRLTCAAARPPPRRRCSRRCSSPPRRARAPTGGSRSANYQWSSPDIHIDLGEHVTWYWVGPDTMHSVTGRLGQRARASTPTRARLPPPHLGDNFQSASPAGHLRLPVQAPRGRPRHDHGVRPARRPVDRAGPGAAEQRRHPAALHGRRAARFDVDPRKKGTHLRMGLDERGTADAEIYRLEGPKDRGGSPAGRAGRPSWGSTAFPSRTARSTSRRALARYLAEIRATDRSNNTSRPQNIRFSIR